MAGNISTYAGVAQLVERDLAKVEVTGSNPATRSIFLVQSSEHIIDIWRRSQVAKAEVCKTFIHRFKSDRRLQFFRFAEEKFPNIKFQITNNYQ